MGDQVYTEYNGYQLLRPKKHYSLLSPGSYATRDTLTNNNITNWYFFTFEDKRFLTQKYIDCTISFEWRDLASGNFFTTTHPIFFKRRRYLMPVVIHGK